MTELFKHAVEVTSNLPDDLQDEIAQAMLALAGEDNPESLYVLTPEERASMAESLEQAKRGEFASDEEVEAGWAKYDP